MRFNALGVADNLEIYEAHW